jgi:hypothetical protein
MVSQPHTKDSNFLFLVLFPNSCTVFQCLKILDNISLGRHCKIEHISPRAANTPLLIPTKNRLIPEKVAGFA